MPAEAILVYGLRYRFNHLKPDANGLKVEFVGRNKGCSAGQIPWVKMKQEFLPSVVFPTPLPLIDFSKMKGVSGERQIQDTVVSR